MKAVNAFAIVGAVAEFALQVALEVELRFERRVRRRVQRALGRRESARRRLRQLREQRIDGLRKFRIRRRTSR